MANNRKKDPNSEYKKKSKLARFLRSRDPYKPIIKNIGIRLASKKKKNQKISKNINKLIKQNSKKIILFNKKVGFLV
jgi:ribosomal protein L18E